MQNKNISLSLVLMVSLFANMAIAQEAKPKRQKTSAEVVTAEVAPGFSNTGKDKRKAVNFPPRTSLYEQLLEFGRNEEESDLGIDLLRAKAMLAIDTTPQSSAIGDMLFRYSISDPKALSNALDKIGTEQAYLASCLLDGNLSEFCDTIDINAYKTMPSYYMQALVMANDSLAQAKFPKQYADEQSSYNSFREALAAVESEPKQFQANTTFINYHESYFWFYTFKR